MYMYIYNGWWMYTHVHPLFCFFPLLSLGKCSLSIGIDVGINIGIFTFYMHMPMHMLMNIPIPMHMYMYNEQWMMDVHTCTPFVMFPSYFISCQMFIVHWNGRMHRHGYMHIPHAHAHAYAHEYTHKHAHVQWTMDDGCTYMYTLCYVSFLFYLLSNVHCPLKWMYA